MLDPLLGRCERVALVGFPNHSNVGDSAIWLGELAYLRAAGRRLVYACDERSYSPDHLRRRLGDGTLLLHGGGNLGDLWPTYEELRERVIADFPDNRIVQLPQTMRFEDPRALERARAVLDAHGGLTLLLRDRASLAAARRSFEADARLCPDMALSLGPLPRPRQPATDVLWLLRTDKESAGVGVDHRPGTAELDWPPQAPTWAALRWGTRYGGALARRHPPWLDGLQRAVGSAYAPLARERLRTGCRLLAGARAVVTDRLHGHLLCLLLGIPHVCLENSYGKVGSFMETWTEGCGLGRRASPAEAARLAADIVAGAVPARRRQPAAGARWGS